MKHLVQYIIMSDGSTCSQNSQFGPHYYFWHWSSILEEVSRILLTCNTDYPLELVFSRWQPLVIILFFSYWFFFFKWHNTRFRASAITVESILSIVIFLGTFFTGLVSQCLPLKGSDYSRWNICSDSGLNPC